MMELIEILMGIIEALAEICDLVRGWRFSLCLLAGILAIGSIYGLIENDRLSLALAIPVASFFFITGWIWDARSG